MTSDCFEDLLEATRLGVTLIEFILSITGLEVGRDPDEVNLLKPLIPVGVVGGSPVKELFEMKKIWYIHPSVII